MTQKLKEIAKIRAGHAFRKKLAHDPEQKLQVIQMKDLTHDGTINWNTMIKSAPAASNTDWVRKDDLLLVSRGANNFVYFINEEPPLSSLAAPYFFHITLLPSYREKVLPEFLAWQLNQKPIQDYFQMNAEGSTSKAIRREIVENTQLVIPSKEKQKAISSLYNVVSRQKRLYEKLLDNNQILMNKLAKDLLKEATL